ncbi:hypothetical protein [Pseudobutyrivibrio xylanivorans]|uniref:Putative membrane protein n=1 Tax=Pseudobutyrivibrio xylanivorans TaxID=185007 RepID=A0A1G5S4T4_PSEXY|nr:hypothetical protein [Pseudobutyrivibrio xylanivorans]SCZ80850.1 putative membrane protein [Pseudobutyrivibrio xylanivorans]
MIRKSRIKSLSVMMAVMLAVMTVSCGQSTVQNSEKSAVTMETEENSGEDALANSMVSVSNIASAESTADKVETVYVTADANGAVNDVIVSEWLKNDEAAAALDDTTELKNIVNVKGSETYKDDGDGNIVWDAEGSDIYYQGTTDKQLPVKMKITYTLDGKKISPEKLAGKSGKVTIRFEYENNSKQTVDVKGKDVEVYTPFAMVSGMMLDADKFSNVEVSNGKVISDGGKTIVMGVALPGLKESLDISDDKWDKLDDAEEIKGRLSNYFEITADTTDFELGMTITMASSDLLSDFGVTDLSGSDKLKDLKDDMEELNDGSNELVDGTAKLKDGTTDLTDGTKKLYDGAGDLKDGTQKLYDGSAKLKDGAGSLSSGAGTLFDGIKKYTDGVSKVNDGAGKLASGASELHNGTSAFVKGMKDAGLGQQSSNSEGINQLGAGIDQLATGSNQLASGLDKLSTSLNNAEQKMELQRTAYGAIYQWLAGRGTTALSNPLTQFGEIGEAIFGECLSNVSGTQLTTVEAANYWMENVVKPAISAVEAGSNGAAVTRTTTQTVVSESTSDNIATREETSESEPAETPETEPPETPAAEPAEAPAAESEETPTSEPAETPAAEPEEASSEEAAETTAEEPTETAVEADNNTAENNVVTKKIVTTTTTPATYSAVTLAYVQGYYQMCGSAKALYGATDQSIKMFTETQENEEYSLLGSVSALKAGADALKAGAEAVKAGFATLAQTISKLTAGLGTLYENALKLDAGAAQIATGASQLSAGTKELVSNNNSLRDGGDKLAGGAEELYNGTGKLKDGARDLNDGAGDLLNGTKDLYDGSIELDDGVQELYDGMTKFDEEGIKKIYEAFDGELSDFADRIEAIQEAGSNYKTFGGSSEDVDSSVKFIIKTDGIKNL